MTREVSCFSTAAELAESIRAGAISSREIVDASLSRIERLNTAVNAIVTLDPDGARTRAAELDALHARGQVLGPLHGVPVTVKDHIAVAGLRLTAGSRYYANNVASANAPAVERLVRSGAVVVGMTNMPEFGADVQTFNELFGTTNNPHDLERSAGGSSGGAAAAVSCGMCALGLGSDIAGSIRIPAHYCGVYGHKPSYALVPNDSGMVRPGLSVEPDMIVFGPLSRSAEDLRLAMEALLAGSPRESGCPVFRLPAERHRVLKDFRVAIWFDDKSCPLDLEIRSLFSKLVDTLRAIGANVEEKRCDGFDLQAASRVWDGLYLALLASAVPRGRMNKVRFLWETLRYQPSLFLQIARSSVLSHRRWLSLVDERSRFRAHWAQLFRDYDVMLCPVSPIAAPPHDRRPLSKRSVQINGDRRSYWDQMLWTKTVGSLTYLPATAVPIGMTAAGLPVGVQIVGPYLEDWTPIEFARLLGGVLDPIPRPTIAGPVQRSVI